MLYQRPHFVTFLLSVGLLIWGLLIGSSSTHLWQPWVITGFFIWGFVYQKQVSRAGTCNCIPQYLWDVVTCPCPWYLLLAHKSTYEVTANRKPFFFKLQLQLFTNLWNVILVKCIEFISMPWDLRLVFSVAIKSKTNGYHILWRSVDSEMECLHKPGLILHVFDTEPLW